MKKLFFTLLLILGPLSTMDVKAQYGVVVYGQEKDTLCFITDNLVKISHDEPNKDDVTLVCPDTTFVRNILSIDSIIFVSIPDRMVLTEDIGDWSEMRLCKDGTVVLTKLENDEKPLEMVLMCPDDSLGVVFSHIQFNEDAYPVEMTMNEYRLTLDWIDNETFNLTVVLPDSISYNYDSLRVTHPMAMSVKTARLVPDIDRRPWLVRVGGAIEVIGGVGAVFVGGVTIAGSGVAEFMTAGASTPVSIPALLLGGATVYQGIQSIENGYMNAFTDNYYGSGNNNVLITLGVQGGMTLLDQVAVPWAADNLPTDVAEYVGQRSSMPNVVGSWASTLTSLLGRIVSNTQHPYTITDFVRDVQDGVKTGLHKDETHHSVTLRGYIWPYILKSPSVYFDTDYGIIVYSSTNNKERYKKTEINGDGGMIEFTFNGLKPSTKYNYYTYLWDKTNHVAAMGEIKSFETKALLPIIKDFKVTKSQYKKGGFTYEGVNYDYRFDVSVKVAIDDIDGVADWGYVYRDPNGRDKEISLKQFGTSYTDSRYAYFRNTSPATVTLMGYVKYVGSDEPIYGEPIDYTLSHIDTSCPDANHPHWIDLGLPSGTKWRCCNEGASTPEAYGGYYAFGQVASAPTLYQIKEVLNNTTSVWTTQNGVYGRNFTSRINGCKIFLPAAGSRMDGCFYGEGEEGDYWSCTPDGEYNGYLQSFSSVDVIWSYWGGYMRPRYYEQSVRPVR